jgi:hypothetical protein
MEGLEQLSQSIDIARDVNKKIGPYDSLELSKMSSTSATKFVYDNPRFEHQVNLKYY